MSVLTDKPALLLRLTSFTLLALGLAGSTPAKAQVLARPGWAGSGVAPEAWWLRGVFYRLDPVRFQDSDGDGRGDLAGVVQRLDYLQSLGVDALVLDRIPDPQENDALGDLVREASRHQLRVLVTAGPELAQGPRDAFMNTVRGWLGAGVAGIWLPRAGMTQTTEAGYAALVSSVRSLVQSFPGDRVLLNEATPVALSLAPRPVRLTRRIDPGTFRAVRGGQLVTSGSLAVGREDVSTLRSSLAAVAEDPAPGSNALLRFAHPPATGSADAIADAALLLGSRTAVMLDFGEEIGMDLYPADPATVREPVMQWTPSNRTQAAAEPSTGADGQKPLEPQFGAYHPYVPPPRGLTNGMSAPVRVTPDLNVPEALPDADSLPGFTAGTLLPEANGTSERNVITEDRNPKSLLNAYRQLIALHHGNATLRNGTQTVVPRDAEHTLVWVRRAPAGSRTVANVVDAVNVSDQPVTLSLDNDLEAQGMRPGALRPLFSSVPEATTGESTEHLVLPAHGAFFGEIYHAGALSEPAPRVHRGGGRHSDHRVRH